MTESLHRLECLSKMFSMLFFQQILNFKEKAHGSLLSFSFICFPENLLVSKISFAIVPWRICMIMSSVSLKKSLWSCHLGLLYSEHSKDRNVYQSFMWMEQEITEIGRDGIKLKEIPLCSSMLQTFSLEWKNLSARVQKNPVYWYKLMMVNVHLVVLCLNFFFRQLCL